MFVAGTGPMCARWRPSGWAGNGGWRKSGGLTLTGRGSCIRVGRHLNWCNINKYYYYDIKYLITTVGGGSHPSLFGSPAFLQLAYYLLPALDERYLQEFTTLTTATTTATISFDYIPLPLQ